MGNKRTINDRSVKRLAKKTGLNFGPTWNKEPVVCPDCGEPGEDAFTSPENPKKITLHEWPCLDCGARFGILMPKFTKTHLGYARRRLMDVLRQLYITPPKVPKSDLYWYILGQLRGRYQYARKAGFKRSLVHEGRVEQLNEVFNKIINGR